MSLHLTLATASRVLRQIRHDRRTIVMLLVVPCVLMGLLSWIYDNTPVFDRIGAPLLGVFPFVVMFMITSVTMLRERQSGTLERLLSLPVAKADLVGGYAVAFSGLAIVQASIATMFSVGALGLDVEGPVGLLLLVAMVDAMLGSALGLFLSAFARTEFQAVQFMPAFVLPQFLLCGLLVPRSQLPGPLEAVSQLLPLSHAVDAMRTLTTPLQWRGWSESAGSVFGDLAVVLLFVVAAIGLGATTLRRRTA